MRIVIVGGTGCGKTTLAQQLGEPLQTSVYDLDEFYWLPNWQPRSVEKFEQKVSEIVNSEDWLISGNYSAVRAVIWAAADVIIWLDYPFSLTLWRLLKRSWQRLVTKAMICNGNHETWRRILSPQHSIIIWLFKSYWRRWSEYRMLLPHYQHVLIYKNAVLINQVMRDLQQIYG